MSYLFIKNLFQREKFALFSTKKKFKKKKIFLVGFFRWVFWVVFGWVFWGGFFIANPVLRTRATCWPPPAPASATPASTTPFRSPCCRPGSFRFLFSFQNFSGYSIFVKPPKEIVPKITLSGTKYILYADAWSGAIPCSSENFENFHFFFFLISVFSVIKRELKFT